MSQAEAKNVYSTLKIFAHPKTIDSLNNGQMVAPHLVHMMWQNLCNHDCEFCSYRRSGNKNNQMFNEKQWIPKEKMLETLNDLYVMGTKAIEITGGGEPTIYPYFKEGVEKMVECNFDIGIVSNGSNFKEDWMKIMSPNLNWARISIDSGDVKDYTEVRKVSEKHWERAWKTVANLRKHGKHPEFTLGVGFVVTWQNYKGVAEAIRLAKENGAHNIRISAAFTEKSLDYYSIGSKYPDVNTTSIIIRKVSEDVKQAKEKYDDENFKVFNLFDERVENMVEATQDYDYCMAKEVVCVVGGDQKVYTCCSLAFNKNGLIGDIENKSFKDLWFSEETKQLFKTHDPRKICQIMCLYEKRNKEFLANRHKDPSSVLNGSIPKHKNFI